MIGYLCVWMTWFGGQCAVVRRWTVINEHRASLSRSMHGVCPPTVIFMSHLLRHFIRSDRVGLMYFEIWQKIHLPFRLLHSESTRSNLVGISNSFGARDVVR